MKSFWEKFVATIVIFSLCLGLCFDVIVFRPKTAKALDGGAGFINNIKELILDAVANVVSNMVYKRLEQNIYDWGTGRKSSIRLPFGIEDFNDYFDEFLNQASAIFLQSLRNTPLCTGISIQFGKPVSFYLPNARRTIRTSGASARFPATFGTYYSDRPSYQQTAACTLDKVIHNVEAFVQRPKITIFGWDAWKALNSPQNNVFSAFFSALDAKTQAEVRQMTNASYQATVSGGYRNQSTTTANSRDACQNACAAGTGLATCKTGGGAETPGTGTLGLPCASANDCDAFQSCTRGVCTSTLSTTTGSACDQDKATCISNCRRIPFTPIATAVSNLGSQIHAAADQALSSDLARIINVSEITQLAGIFFQALFNKAMNGLGLAFNSVRATHNQQNRSANIEKYSYLRQFAKTNSAANKKESRTALISGLEQSIKSLDRSIVACDSDTMMTDDDWAKNIADVLQEHLEGLYVGIEGINIQPDSVVLDPPYAPYSVYGYSWGEVFPVKVPEKCRLMLNQLNMSTNTTCSDIISGLEPNYGLTAVSGGGGGGGGGVINRCILDSSLPGCPHAPYAMDIIPGIGNSPCVPCMYDHDSLNCPVGPTPPQPYPGDGNTVWTNAMLQQKQDLYNNCNVWYTGTGGVLDLCNQCLKNYDEKCNNLDTAEAKSNCIMQHCGYAGTEDPTTFFQNIIPHVIDPPSDGLDFYGKCLVEQQKDSCFTCLKEYYIPATYCEQLMDYTSRMVIKYPAIVVNKYKKDEGEFRGLYDAAVAAKGGLCNDNDGAEDMSVAMICRILPDYVYQGQKICQSWCNHGSPPMTAAQLTDVTDFRPDEADCNHQTLPRHTGNAGGGTSTGVGGKMPPAYISAGVLDSKGKCCADFWQKDRRNYATCVGAGPTTEEGGGGGTSLAVALSATPNIGSAPLNNVDLVATVTGATAGQLLTYNFDCDNNGTFERSVESTQANYTAIDACNYPLNNTTYTASVTIMTEFGVSATATTTIRTTDCEISYTLNPANGIAPANVNITGHLNNVDTGPFTYVFYCDANGSDPSTWSAATVEHVVATNPYTLDSACTFNSGQTTRVGVTIQSSSTTASSWCSTSVRVLSPPAISCTIGVGLLRANAGVGLLRANATVDDIVLETNAVPNDGFMSAIGTASGITFAYDCNGGTQYNSVVHTANDYSDTNTECNGYFGAPGSTSTVSVRVGSASPSGFSAYGTCSTQVTVPEGGTNLP